MQKLFHLVNFFTITALLSLPVFAKSVTSLPEIILNDTNKLPYTTNNKDGFLDVVLGEAFKRVGYKLILVRLPAERGLLSANEGIVDGEVNRIAGIQKVYKNLIPVPERVRNSDFCALSKSTDIINSPEVLGQHVVGYIKGWKIFEKMMSGSDNVITTNNPQQLFRLLKINRIDAALYTCMQGFIVAKELNIADLKVLEPRIKQRGMFMYLNKKHEHIIPALSKALNDIRQEGLYDRWYKEKIVPFIIH